MAKTLTFNELRKIKDQLPSGSMRQIAEKLNLDEETVRNYFEWKNFTGLPFVFACWTANKNSILNLLTTLTKP